MNLYCGKILQVDLTEKVVKEMPLNPQWLEEYWGGWGLAVRTYVAFASPRVVPLSPENPIVIMTGPFTGTSVPLSSRLCLVSKSPKTGTIFESNTGGAFGPELKFAGFDGIIITGKSEKPVYLSIMDDAVTIEDASDLEGKGIFETEEILKQRAGSPAAKVLAIGPAGEKEILFSCVGTEAYRQFGRGGTGALFGSKNLKGIVCRGTGGVSVAEMDAFLKIIEKYKGSNLFTEDNLWAKTDGTAILVGATNELGLHPTKNFSRGVNERHEAIGTEAVKKAKISDRACSSCPLGCGKFTRINGAEVEGPEYETLALGGSNCGINNLEDIIRFNRLCDDLGLDTITTADVIAFAMDLTEKGRKDFGVTFGDVGEYLKIVEEIAGGATPRGKELAMGVRKLAEKYASADLSAEIKDLEFPAYDPRGNYGMGLAYATSERGACHLRAFTIFSEDPFDLEQLADEVIGGQNFNAIKWSMCLCDFWGSVTSEIMAELLSAGLGRNVRAEDLEAAGERIWNLTRLFNLRAGFTDEHDKLPKKMMEQPLQGGPHAGRVFDPQDFLKMKLLYYKKRGWRDDGTPEDTKIETLNLKSVVFSGE